MGVKLSNNLERESGFKQELNKKSRSRDRMGVQAVQQSRERIRT